MGINPLSTKRYAQLADKIDRSWGTIMRYLELRIKIMERELAEEKEGSDARK